MDVKVHSLSYLLDERPSLFSRAAYGPKGRERVKSVLLLNKVSLTLPPGSVSVVLGVGKGYRYLLECIALRRQDGQMAGKLQYDGVTRKRDFYRDIAFVNDFGFAHFGSLTVFDYLYFGARLRLSLGVVECRERARQACRSVGLDGALQLHQLGPAELRIASIALEIVGNPTLVIALDPIKGLDAAGALEVMKVLRTIAKRVSMPTTVLYNLPSVSEDMIPLTDHWTVFAGNSIGYACALKDFAPEVKPQLNKVWSDISLLLVAEAARESTDVFDPVDYSAQGDSSCVRALERAFDALDALIEASHAPPEAANSTREPTATLSKKATTKPAGGETEERKSAELVIEHGKFKGGFLPRLSSAGVPSSHSAREGEVYSVTRRLAETGDGAEGLPVRVPKALHWELWILLTRAVKNHARNVSICRNDKHCANVFNHRQFTAFLANSFTLSPPCSLHS
jgi:ABC-type transporter Mla maintaining outer membrane lipid asymmetry ATPase subunit MlaF